MNVVRFTFVFFFFFQAEDGIRDLVRSRGLGDVYKRQVQEMIDICDFAVGLSRQLHGLTMHSERPGHRMYAVSYTHLTLPTSDLV